MLDKRLLWYLALVLLVVYMEISALLVHTWNKPSCCATTQLTHDPTTDDKP